MSDTIRYTVQNVATGVFLCHNAHEDIARGVLTTLTLGTFAIPVTAHDHAGLYGRLHGDNRAVARRTVTVRDTTRQRFISTVLAPLRSSARTRTMTRVRTAPTIRHRSLTLPVFATTQ